MTRLTHLWNVPRALCMAYENGFFQAFKHKQLQFSYTTHFESYQLSCSTTLPSLALSLLARSTSTSYSPSSSHIQQEKYRRREPHRVRPVRPELSIGQETLFSKRLCSFMVLTSICQLLRSRNSQWKNRRRKEAEAAPQEELRGGLKSPPTSKLNLLAWFFQSSWTPTFS